MSVTKLSLLATSLLLVGGCANNSHSISVPIAGGEVVRFQRTGSILNQAENDRAVVTDAGLQAVNYERNPYLRWTFALRPKQPTNLAEVRVEDVSDSVPAMLVNDLAPQQDAGKWSSNSGLIELSPTSLPWFFDKVESIRTFRFTIREAEGKKYVLYQAALYTPAAKEAIQNSIRR